MDQVEIQNIVIKYLNMFNTILIPFIQNNPWVVLSLSFVAFIVLLILAKIAISSINKLLCLILSTAPAYSFYISSLDIFKMIIVLLDKKP